MKDQEQTFTATIWRHDGPAAWYFISLPEDLADELRSEYEHRQRPFGSLAVRARIGETEWDTSVFFDRKRATYLLPVKAKIRSSEGLEDGDEVQLRIAPIDS